MGQTVSTEDWEDAFRCSYNEPLPLINGEGGKFRQPSFLAAWEEEEEANGWLTVLYCTSKWSGDRSDDVPRSPTSTGRIVSSICFREWQGRCVITKSSLLSAENKVDQWCLWLIRE